MQNPGEIIGEGIGKIFGWLDFINLEPIAEAFETLEPYITAVCYFLPMGTIKAIFIILISLFTFTLIIRIVKLIWELIPFL